MYCITDSVQKPWKNIFQFFLYFVEAILKKKKQICLCFFFSFHFFSSFLVIKVFCGRRDLNSHEHYSSDSKSEASTIPPRPLKKKSHGKKQTDLLNKFVLLFFFLIFAFIYSMFSEGISKMFTNPEEVKETFPSAKAYNV